MGLRLRGRGKYGPSERVGGKAPAGTGSGVPQRLSLDTRSLPRGGGGDAVSCLRRGAAWSGPAEHLGELGGAAGARWHRWHCQPDPERRGGLGRQTPNEGLGGELRCPYSKHALNPRCSLGGTGWLGRCPAKGLVILFLLQTALGEAGGGMVSMPAARSGGGDKTNPSGRAGISPAPCRAVVHPARDSDPPPGEALLMRLFTCEIKSR